METVSNVVATSAASPKIMGHFTVKGLPYTPTVIVAALSLIAGMEKGGVFMTSEAHTLGYLLPSSVESGTPLHVIAMNNEAEFELDALAQEPPYCTNVSIGDQLHSHTFVWFGREDGPYAGVSAAQCWRAGPVVRLFLTPARAILVSDTIGEERFQDLNGANCAGSNYNTGNAVTNSKSVEARHAARQTNNGGNAIEFTRHQVHLVVCTFDRARLTAQNFLVPDNFPTEEYLCPVEQGGLNAIVRYRAEDDEYVLDNTTLYMSTRIEVCAQVARAIAIKCLQELLTIHVSQSKQEILELYFEQAQLLKKVTRAEACWAVCRAAEQLGWHPPQQVIEELRTYCG